MSKSAFVDAVKIEFAFLTSDYTFSLKSVRLGTIDDTFEQVWYESDRVQICVWHDAKTMDGDVQLRWLADADARQSFSLQALIELHTGTQPDAQSVPSTEDRLKAWLARMSHQLRNPGDGALRGERAVFDQLRARRAERHAEAIRRQEADPRTPELKRRVEEELRRLAQRRAENRSGRKPKAPISAELFRDPNDQAMQTRTKIVSAFGREDWHEAVRLLESITAYLTPLEREQLAFAQARAKTSNDNR